MTFPALDTYPVRYICSEIETLEHFRRTEEHRDMRQGQKHESTTEKEERPRERKVGRPNGYVR